jgi:hypothetical protein
MKLLPKTIVCVCVLLWLCSTGNAQLSLTGFTWSGHVNVGDGVLLGEYDLLFKLFDHHTGGSQLGFDWTQDNVDVSDGFVRFVELDFGIDIFDGQTRWLEISYREVGTDMPYQTSDVRKAIIRSYLPLMGGDGNIVSSLRVGSEGFARHALDVSSAWATIGINGTGQDSITGSAGIKLEKNGVTKWHIYNNASDDTLRIYPGDDEADMVKVNTTLNAKNGILGSVVIGGDPTGIGYALSHGTVGVIPPANNLRLQSPNGIYFHVGVEPNEAYGTAIAIDPNGNVGVGTHRPAYKLDVVGTIRAREYLTGDIIFQKDGIKPVWRMYEDEAGLYVESLTTGKHYSVVLEEKDSKSDTKSRMEALEAENAELKIRLQKVESLVQQLRVSIN